MVINITKDNKPIDGRIVENTQIYQILRGVSYGIRSTRMAEVQCVVADKEKRIAEDA